MIREAFCPHESSVNYSADLHSRNVFGSPNGTEFMVHVGVCPICNVEWLKFPEPARAMADEKREMCEGHYRNFSPDAPTQPRDMAQPRRPEELP